MVAASSAVPETVSVDELNALSALLAKATKSIADAAGAIPSYDQKQYEGVSRLITRCSEMLWKEAVFFRSHSQKYVTTTWKQGVAGA